MLLNKTTKEKNCFSSIFNENKNIVLGLMVFRARLMSNVWHFDDLYQFNPADGLTLDILINVSVKAFSIHNFPIKCMCIVFSKLLNLGSG